MDESWVKLFRKLLFWKWFQDPITLQVWIFLLLSASFRPSDFQGIHIQRGQVVTSYAKIAERCGISVRNARTAIHHLKQTGEVTSKAYSKFSVFTIVCYDEYQGMRQADRQADRQASDKQLTTLEDWKNERINKNIVAVNEPFMDWESEIPECFHGQFPSLEAYQAFARGEDDY